MSDSASSGILFIKERTLLLPREEVLVCLSGRVGWCSVCMCVGESGVECACVWGGSWMALCVRVCVGEWCCVCVWGGELDGIVSVCMGESGVECACG